MNDEELWELVRIERLRLADDLAGLTPEQLAVASQCDRWTVGEVAAHLITPFETSTARFLWSLVRSGFGFDRTILRMTARVHANNDHDQVVAKLRANAENRWTPPSAGVGIVLAEVVVHGQDVRRPLGFPANTPAETVSAALSAVDDAETRADYTRRVGVDVPA